MARRWLVGFLAGLGAIAAATSNAEALVMITDLIASPSSYSARSTDTVELHAQLSVLGHSGPPSFEPVDVSLLESQIAGLSINSGPWLASPTDAYYFETNSTAIKGLKLPTDETLEFLAGWLVPKGGSAPTGEYTGFLRISVPDDADLGDDAPFTINVHTPEPGSLALFAIGALAPLLRRRRSTHV